ncbi:MULTISPECIES: PilW family protein [unclassified Motilimonas]|uniref:PilW family protein n=1 Tax=unclassified Motilimonas TaxID=2643697 RepID=UPI001E41A0D0|nr:MULTISPECIES: PilW family protein [unclassified Motilimonas]MCE0558659.1 PilW family protein [Motilimonas sp. E26]MDO6525689.1 PilW family protein [Motilimonas sp. 1_MG-2023]
MHNSPTQKHQAGYGLIEWMIAITIGLFLIAGLSAVFINSRVGAQSTNQMGELQETGRVALQLLTQDLRQVGFWGLATANLVTRYNAVKSNEVIVPNLASSKDCLDDLGNGSFPKSSVQYRQFWSFELPANSSLSYMHCLIDNDANTQLTKETDVISIKRLLGQSISVPSAGLTTATAPFFFQANNTKAMIFKGNAAIPSVPTLNDSETWQFLHHVYYLDRQLSTNTPNLRRLTLNTSGMTLEPVLLSGIENMQIQYIVENATGKTSFQTNAQPNDKVIGAQVFVLVRALDQSHGYKNNNSYQLGDKTVQVNDNYRRLLVSTSVTFNNPVWLSQGI